LSRIESGRRVFAEGAFFDHDDVNTAPQGCFRRAQAGQAAAGDQEIAGQAFIGGGRRREFLRPPGRKPNFAACVHT
jgi:hypothetical protein